MEQSIVLNRIDTRFKEEVESLSGQKLSNCYQCGKCSAGCPIAYSLESPPHKIMRMVQAGLKDKALSSPGIWRCLSCVTCTARCPKEVDLANVMNTLRGMAKKNGTAKKERITMFEEMFLNSIRKHGRLFEMGTILHFNVKTYQPFQDIDLFHPLLQREKINFTPKVVRGYREIERIFQIFKDGE